MDERKEGNVKEGKDPKGQDRNKFANAQANNLAANHAQNPEKREHHQWRSDQKRGVNIRVRGERLQVLIPVDAEIKERLFRHLTQVLGKVAPLLHRKDNTVEQLTELGRRGVLRNVRNCRNRRHPKRLDVAHNKRGL